MTTIAGSSALATGPAHRPVVARPCTVKRRIATPNRFGVPPPPHPSLMRREPDTRPDAAATPGSEFAQAPQVARRSPIPGSRRSPHRTNDGGGPQNEPLVDIAPEPRAVSGRRCARTVGARRDPAWTTGRSSSPARAPFAEQSRPPAALVHHARGRPSGGRSGGGSTHGASIVGPGHSGSDSGTFLVPSRHDWSGRTDLNPRHSAWGAAIDSS